MTFFIAVKIKGVTTSLFSCVFCRPCDVRVSRIHYVVLLDVGLTIVALWRSIHFAENIKHEFLHLVILTLTVCVLNPACIFYLKLLWKFRISRNEYPRILIQKWLIVRTTFLRISVVWLYKVRDRTVSFCFKNIKNCLRHDSQ